MAGLLRRLSMPMLVYQPKACHHSGQPIIPRTDQGRTTTITQVQLPTTLRCTRNHPFHRVMIPVSTRLTIVDLAHTMILARAIARHTRNPGVILPRPSFRDIPSNLKILTTPTTVTVRLLILRLIMAIMLFMEERSPLVVTPLIQEAKEEEATYRSLSPMSSRHGFTSI